MGARILLVEDNPFNRELMRALLRQRGHEVVTANDVDASIAALSNGPFDIALVDLLIPGGGGEALVATLETRSELAGMIKVAVTAKTAPGTKERLLALGFDGYLPKPVDVRTFSAEVESFVATAPPATEPMPSALERRLAALRDDYRRNLPRAIAAIEASLVEARANGAALRRAIEGAHRLAGSAGSHGFSSITEAARALEDALASVDGSASLGHSEALFAALKREVDDAAR